MAKSKAAKKPLKKVASVKADKRASKGVKSLAKTASAPVEKAKTKSSTKAPAAVLKSAKAPSKAQESIESVPVAAAAGAPKREGQGSTKLSLKLNEKNPAKAEKVAKPARQTRKSKAEELNLEKSNQLSQKWSTLFRKSQDQEAKPYNMRGQFEAKTPIVHKLLGWGYIMANKNDRLEVLFQDGIRYLISNYKS